MNPPVYVAITLGLAVLGLAVAWATSSDEANAVTFTVNKTADTADGVCDADCSLREAIIAANGTGPASADIITVPAGTYTLSIAGHDVASNAAIGDLDITTGSVTINGAGPGSTIIDGADIDRILDIKSNVQGVTINGVTIRNGYAVTAALNVGGGVATATNSNTTLNNVAVSDNRATTTGGGIYNHGTLTINNSTIGPGNIAKGNGGGIDNDTGTLMVNNSVIYGNTANGLHGGGLNSSYNARLTNVTISDNTITGGNGSAGAGIRHSATSATNGDGSPTTMTLLNVTISNNSSKTGGGLGRTSAGWDPVVKNTIIANNSGGNCSIATGTLTSQGDNISSDGTCPLPAAGDMNNTNPILGALQSNGGPTLTRALAQNSAAIDAASSAGCPPTDQRGTARPIGLSCDIGAYEHDNPTTSTPPPLLTATPSLTPSPSPTLSSTPAGFEFGDVDCDGQINSVDALKVLNYGAGLSYNQTEPCQNIGSEILTNGEQQGNVDCDGTVNSVDALKLLLYSAGLKYRQSEPCSNIGS